jgi:hypothetical protein
MTALLLTSGHLEGQAAATISTSKIFRLSACLMNNLCLKKKVKCWQGRNCKIYNIYSIIAKFTIFTQLVQNLLNSLFYLLVRRLIIL